MDLLLRKYWPNSLWALSFKRHNIFLATILIGYLALGFLIPSVYENVKLFNFSFYFIILNLLVKESVAIFLFLFIFVLFKNMNNGPNALSKSIVDLRTRHFEQENFIFFICFLIFLPFFFHIYNSYKRSIPYIHPFSWDGFFMKFDYILHFNHHPFELLIGLFKFEGLLRIIDFYYLIIWHAFLFGFLLWMAWAPHCRIRNQFLISFFTIWIFLGTVLATIFSSVGPCYFSQISGADSPYAPLMGSLYSINDIHPLYVIDIQQFLWHAYKDNVFSLGSGISAMPSVHVATATLWAIVGWKINRFWGLFFSFLLTITFLGSIILGWHYAVDGYFSILLTIIIWKLVGRFLAIPSLFLKE